jgi:uncharacterized protein YkwD
MDRQRSHLVQLLLSGALLLCATPLAACAGQGARAEHPSSASVERMELPGPGAATYETQTVAGPVFQDGSGALRTAFDRALRARGLKLQGDARLTQLSRFIADHVTPQLTLPSQAARDAAAHHLGLVEPTPLVSVGTAARDGIAERLKEDIRALLADRVYTHYGGVMVERDGIALYVVALASRFVDLDPVPRHIGPGQTITLAGQLTHGHTAPELAITEPDGHVVRGTPALGSKLRFQVPMRTRGVYRVEVLGEGPQGITVVANFPIYVGEQPPDSIAVSSGNAAPVDAEHAARQLLDYVNAERAKVKLAPLELDAKLSEIALAHVDDMLEHGFIAHTSPTTGTAADRVTRAGVRSRIVLENIGRGYGLREVHESLMASPGHRGNILHELVNRIGIAVRTTPESSRTAYLVTEVFTRATPKLSGDATEELLSRINAKRKSLGRARLESDHALSDLAGRTAARCFTSPAPSDAALMQTLREQLPHLKLKARSVGTVLTVASSLEELSEIDSVLEPNLKWIGLGLSQGSRPDTPENPLCAVLLLGE